VVDGVPTFGNMPSENISAGSGMNPVRSDGYFAITNFDLLDRYIIDALIRNDGSSLFGPDERRQWYYRLAGAWRISEEPWMHVPALNELKLRYSLGHRWRASVLGRPVRDLQRVGGPRFPDHAREP
jgi:hypothetical protein